MSAARVVQRLCLLWLSGLLSVGFAGCLAHVPARSITPASPVISHWDYPLRPSVPPSSPAALQQFWATQRQERFTVYSRQPYHEVDIPLWIQDGYPYVRAFWSGRQIACQIDTGTSTIVWPQWLHLDTRQMHLSRTRPWPDGVTIRTEWTLSSYIVLGRLAYRNVATQAKPGTSISAASLPGLVLTNVPTEALGLPQPTRADPSTRTFPTLGLNCPILGMQPFMPFVMTIDYTGKRLILRDPHYDVTRQPHHPHSLITHYQDYYATAALPGTLGGHPARFVLDTGSPALYVTASFAQRFLSFDPRATAPGDSTPVLHNVDVSLFGRHSRIKNVYVAKQLMGADATLGGPVFAHYRVTIDRFRKVVMFEKTR